jgi:hypothetical protein
VVSLIPRIAPMSQDEFPCTIHRKQSFSLEDSSVEVHLAGSAHPQDDVGTLTKAHGDAYPSW